MDWPRPKTWSCCCSVRQDKTRQDLHLPVEERHGEPWWIRCGDGGGRSVQTRSSEGSKDRSRNYRCFLYIYIISNNKPIKDQDLNVFTCCWCNSTFLKKINVKIIQFQHQLFRVKTITSFFFLFSPPYMTGLWIFHHLTDFEETPLFFSFFFVTFRLHCSVEAESR